MITLQVTPEEMKAIIDSMSACLRSERLLGYHVSFLVELRGKLKYHSQQPQNQQPVYSDPDCAIGDRNPL